MSNIPDAPTLLGLGWTLTRDRRGLTLSTEAGSWDNLDWAHRTALRASFGFGTHGFLNVVIGALKQNAVNLRAILAGAPQPGGQAMPKGHFHGADARLRTILETERTGLQDTDHDRWGLLHTGLDGSVIYTSREFWGPLQDGYPEIQDNDYRHWEQVVYGIPEAPCWACPECNTLD